MHNANQSLAHEIPYWDVISDPVPHVVLHDGSISLGLELVPLDIECFDAANINNLTLTFRTFLNSLQEKTGAQIYLRVHSDFKRLIDKHERDRLEDLNLVIREIDDQRLVQTRADMSEGSLYNMSLYLILKEPTRLQKRFSLFSSSEKFTALSKEQYQETLEALTQNMESAKGVLEGAGIRVKTLSRDETLDILYSCLNPMRAKVEPTPEMPEFKKCDLELATLPQSTRERLLFGDVVFGTGDFTLNSVTHRVITIKNMPEVTYAGMLASILRLKFHYELTLSIDSPDQSRELSRLQQGRRMAHSLAAGSGQRPADLENESKLSSTEELLREILNSGQKIFSFQFRIVLKVQNSKSARRHLEQMTREVLSRIRSLSGAEAIHETVGSWKIFKNDLPFAPIEQIRGKRIKTNNLADFLPLYGPRRGDDDPVVILHNRLGGLVSLNPFDSKLPNYNALVTGSSGAGKSFLNNYITLQQMTRKTRLFVIDIGGSYKKLTEALGGEYFEISLSDKYTLNPFVLSEGETEPSSQKLKSLVAIVEQMVTEDDRQRLSKMDRVLLERAIIETYKSVTGRWPRLSDLRDRCEKAIEPELKKISVLLYPWTGERPYGKLLDRDSGIATNKIVTAFDLKGLSQYPDLQGVMILILTDFILREVEADKSSFKRIILDEAWELLKSQAAANFMEYCARTLRKTGSGITFITQGLEEIVSSPIGSAIINNTATKIVLLQRGDTKTLVSTLKINPHELTLIQSLRSKKGEYSEAFLIEGEERQVIRVYPSPMEYWLSTSDATDNLFIQELMEQKQVTLWDAVKLAAAAYPWGRAMAPSLPIANEEET